MRIDEIQSGSDQSVLAKLLRAGLWLGSVPYGIAVRHRNHAYDVGRKPVTRVDAAVICVGNLTTGGTGKTPIVCHLARWLGDQGHRVVLVSRGYRGGRRLGDRATNETATNGTAANGTAANDEAMELAERLPAVPHIQNPDRVQAAQDAIAQHDADVILMDDGFQHRRLDRDIDIAVVDATCPFGHGHLLPRGMLREPVEGLSRAAAAIVTRCDLVTPQSLEHTESTLRNLLRADAPIVRSSHQPSALRVYPDQVESIERLHGQRQVTLCAIGNPAAFERTVTELGGKVIDSIRFPDHDSFGPAAIDRISQFASDHRDDFDVFVCTHKDLVKLRRTEIAGKPLRAVQIELQLGDGRQALYEVIQAAIGQRV